MYPSPHSPREEKKGVFLVPCDVSCRQRPPGQPTHGQLAPQLGEWIRERRGSNPNWSLLDIGRTDQRYKSYDLNSTDSLPAGDFFGKP